MWLRGIILCRFRKRSAKIKYQCIKEVKVRILKSLEKAQIILVAFPNWSVKMALKNDFTQVAYQNRRTPPTTIKCRIKICQPLAVGRTNCDIKKYNKISQIKERICFLCFRWRIWYRIIIKLYNRKSIRFCIMHLMSKWEAGASAIFSPRPKTTKADLAH